jgi:hypothetical protein
LEFGLKLVSSVAATNLSLLGGCRIRDITLLFAASIPFDNFENQQQDKATDTQPNKPNIGARPTEQNIEVPNIGVRPSFGAFDQGVPAGPPRHHYLPLINGNRAVMAEVGDSDKNSRRAFWTVTARKSREQAMAGFQGAVAGLKFW